MDDRSSYNLNKIHNSWTWPLPDALLFYWLQGVHLLRVQCILPGVESRSELVVPQRETVSYPFWGKKFMTKKQIKTTSLLNGWLFMTWTVSCVTLSLTRKDDAIANYFWCNTAEQVASHTKIDFGLKRLATAVYARAYARTGGWGLKPPLSFDILQKLYYLRKGV